MVRTASPVREAHLSPPRLPSPKHRPIVENGTFSTGPFVRNRREPRPGRPCEAPPTQDICQRGVRGPARRMETSPAPGSLWFLSPAGKELVRPQTHETPSSNILIPAYVPPSPHHPLPAGTKKALHVLTRTELSLISIPTSQTPRSWCGRESSSRSQGIDPADTSRRDPSIPQS